MKSRLDEIRARCEAATPGPWNHDGMHDEVHGPENDWLIDEGELPDHPDAKPFDQFGHRVNSNYVFAAHAREDVPWLLDEIERLQAENTALRRERDALANELDSAQPCFACAGFRQNGGKCFGAGTCRIAAVARHEGVEYKDLSYGETWEWRGPYAAGKSEG